MKIPQKAPTLVDLFAEEGRDPGALVQLITTGHPVDSGGRYLHWDDMRGYKPPNNMTLRDWWLTTAWAREAFKRQLPLRSLTHEPFKFCNVDQIQEMVHRIDQQASGRIIAEDVVTNLRASDRYLISSLVEEAITSSQLEGASTTRRVAKEMLATGRRPRDISEQMILYNFTAMVHAQDLAHEPLTPEAVLNLHRILTEDTLEVSHCGRLQTEADKRIAVYWHDDTLLHQPPPAHELPERLALMCEFANGSIPD